MEIRLFKNRCLIIEHPRNFVNPKDLEVVLKNVIPVLVEEVRTKLVTELAKILAENKIVITFEEKKS